MEQAATKRTSELMPAANHNDEAFLRTSAGELPLNEYCLKASGREWRILHVGALLSSDEEAEYLLSPGESLPYGVTLWAASIALAHELAARTDLRGMRILELGAGTGLPGIVAASGGARVVQTDGNKVALALAKRNLRRNGLDSVDQHLVDWKNWNHRFRYDLIIGSDILYSRTTHPHLRQIFEMNLSASGRLIISDPFRASSITLMEELQNDGWTVAITKWTIGEEARRRAIGIFELSRAG